MNLSHCLTSRSDLALCHVFMIDLILVILTKRVHRSNECKVEMVFYMGDPIVTMVSGEVYWN